MHPVLELLSAPLVELELLSAAPVDDDVPGSVVLLLAEPVVLEEPPLEMPVVVPGVPDVDDDPTSVVVLLPDPPTSDSPPHAANASPKTQTHPFSLMPSS